MTRHRVKLFVLFEIKRRNETAKLVAKIADEFCLLAPQGAQALAGSFLINPMFYQIAPDGTDERDSAVYPLDLINDIIIVP